MTIEDILIEADKKGIRQEVIAEAASIRSLKVSMTQLESYEDAYTRVLNRTH